MKFNKPQSTEGLPVANLSDGMAKYVEEHTEPARPVETRTEESVTIYEATTAVNVRKEPDVEAEVLATLYKHSLIEARSYNAEWVKITAGSWKGAYVRKACLK